MLCRLGPRGRRPAGAARGILRQRRQMQVYRAPVSRLVGGQRRRRHRRGLERVLLEQMAAQGNGEGEIPARREAGQADPRHIQRQLGRMVLEILQGPDAVVHSSRKGRFGRQAVFHAHHDAVGAFDHRASPACVVRRRADAEPAAVEVDHDRVPVAGSLLLSVPLGGVEAQLHPLRVEPVQSRQRPNEGRAWW